MAFTRRVSRFVNSRCGKLVLRFVLLLYLVRCILLFSSDIIQRGTSADDDSSLELHIHAFHPDINLLTFPETSDVAMERLSPWSFKRSSSVKVAIGLAITSKGLVNISAENIREQFVFFKDFLPSFCRTRSIHRDIEYNFYVGYDDVDLYLREVENKLTFELAFELITKQYCGRPIGLTMVTCSYTAKPAWSQNDAMMEAYIDDSDYYYRINDDIVLTSHNWTLQFINKLKLHDPPNVGVVAPLHAGGNQRHMEFDFVHRTHVDIFGWYYPRVFLDLYGDIWMGWVYAPGRAEKLATVTLNHTQASGKRYDEGKKGGGASRRFRLRPELAKSRSLLQK